MSSMFHEAFKIRQVILVNSGAYCYTRIRIDQHTALLGANNSGKTSLLNALKFFLLPEENLNDCVKKFGFKNPDGFYTREQTFGFYFPESSSFIVLEAENPHGPFCVVINPGSKQFSYERTCVPRPYSDIEHLFWDHDSHANNGAGAPIAGLSSASAASQLKALGGVVIRDTETIKARFYHHHHNRPDLGRFCLLPLSQGGKPREIEAWKKLIHLAFDIAAKDKRTLPDTIATIIEGKKDRKEAELNVNLPAILERYEALKATKLRLQEIRNGKAFWDEFEHAYLSFLQSGSAVMNHLQDADAAINEAEKTHHEERQKRFDAHTAANQKSNFLRNQTGDVDTKRKEKIGEMGAVKRQFDAMKKDAEALSVVIHGYPDMTIDQMIESIEAASDDDTKKVESLKDREVFRQEFESRTREINADVARAGTLKALLEGNRKTVLDFLGLEAATALFSLNSAAFSGECESLRSDARESINQFTALFDQRENVLGFLGQATPVAIKEYDAAKVLREREEELSTLSRRINANRKRITEMASDATQTLDQLATKIRELESQIAKDKTNIARLKRKDYIETEYHRLEQELAAATNDLQQLNATHTEISEQLTEAAVHLEQAREELRVADNREANLAAWSKRVQDCIQYRLEFLRDGFSQSERQFVVLDDELIYSLETRVYGTSSDFNILKEFASNLMEAVPQPEHDLAHQSAMSLSALLRIHEHYSLLYGRLDLEENNHYNHVVEHNSDTRLQMQSIEHAKRLIADFIKKIEMHLTEIQVSNIDQVCIEYTLHPQFDELLSTVKSVNMTGGELPTHVLYERIGSFSAEFFDAGQRRDGHLNMARLLVGVEYKVKLAGRDCFASESQSTGTSVMINSRLLAFLLKELLQIDTQVSLPLLIDEISNLDAKNLSAARDIAEADGFFIFGATPDLTTSIGKVICNYVNLDYFRANELAYNRQRTILYTGLNESLTTVQV
ncbi:AAA family ATPase [Pseudomonas corrugata]|uniref:AAA family ATPase n=1 Tax=Pseudomonas corrugata TaxID=47879 RepID=UPI003D814438